MDCSDLYCGSSYSYDQSYDYDNGQCSDSTPGCGCNTMLSNANFFLTDNQDNCYSEVTVYECDIDEECIIDCDSSQSCAGWIIDARNASSLTLNCIASNACEYALIYCPVFGCDILCDASYSCQYSKIYYDGDKPDFGATVSLSCTGGDNACQYNRVYASNAGYVNLYTNVYYGFYYSYIYANNVTELFLNATGQSHCM